MATRKRSKKNQRFRIGSVSVYKHRCSWWLYYRENGSVRRRRASEDIAEAQAIAAQVNAQLAGGRPTFFSFQPTAIEDLVRCWLDYHENVRRSSVATCLRYRAAVSHLVRFVQDNTAGRHAHEVNPEDFLRYLRTIEVAPNGHPNSRTRRLRDKGIKFILCACRSMYGLARTRHFLPPGSDNPFSTLAVDRMRIEDAKPIHVFREEDEHAFLSACDDWQFPLFYILAKTGLRSGELTHLLIDDVDLANGVLHVRSKPELEWQIKTRTARSIPLPAEPMMALRHVIGHRRQGVLFTRRPGQNRRKMPLALLSRGALASELGKRAAGLAEALRRQPTREERCRLAKTVWRDAGAIKTDVIAKEFTNLTRRIGLPNVTAPKCWRHTFATLMQEAGVDPLIRQQTMGHAPAGLGASILGMTAHYTHTQPEVHRRQLAAVLALRPRTSVLVAARFGNRAEAKHGGEQ